MRFPRPMLLAGLALVLSSLPAYAGPLHYGARLGTNLATITGDFAEIADPDTKAGLTGGAFLGLSPAPVLGLELDLLYVEKGFKTKAEVTDASGNLLGTQDFFLKLQYLDVPLLAKVSLPAMGPVSPYVVGGPNLGIGLSAKSEGGGFDHDYTSDLQKLDWGATGGLGVRFGAGPMALGLEARYERSFSDLWDLQDNLESINQGWMVTAWASR